MTIVRPAHIARLRALRDTSGGPDACWPYKGSHLTNGYGRISTTSGGKLIHLLTHRLAYEDAKGPIPAGLVVRHTCDNPPCVNPRHLLIGTRADNNRDRDERKRNRNRYSGVTHCIRGHAFDEENTYTHFTPDGAMRQCRECRRIRRAQARPDHETVRGKSTE